MRVVFSRDSGDEYGVRVLVGDVSVMRSTLNATQLLAQRLQYLASLPRREELRVLGVEEIWFVVEPLLRLLAAVSPVGTLATTSTPLLADARS